MMCKPAVKCVLLADRHHGLAEGIRGLLETVFDVVMMVADANSLFEGAKRLQPVLVVVELSLSGNNGFKIVGKLRSGCPRLKIIVFSMHDEPTLVRSVLEAGADGYVLKSDVGTDLLSAVDAVLAGKSYVSPKVTLNPTATIALRKERT
jgi:DNA-binding NarL/FixJ family response regulator